MLAPAFSSAAIVPQSGPIRRYPTNRDASLPAEVAALGEPEYVHRYESFAEQIHLGWLFGSSADKYPTYISYESALVVVTLDAYTVIPWEEITEFLQPVGFRASSGEKFTLTNDFTNYGPLYERMQAVVLTNVLPQALLALEEGNEWVFQPFDQPSKGDAFAGALLGQSLLEGALAISTSGIRYKDQMLAWDDVASIYVTNHLYNGALCKTTLSVRKNYGLFATMQFDFHTVPNSFLLTELLPYVCPQRLLAKG
jgi:hypothetical protein